MSWTTETVATLRRMWSNGETSGQIARILGVSRCAVIGKIHRLNLTRGAAAPKPEPKPAPKPKKTSPSLASTPRPLADMTKAARARHTKGTLGRAAPPVWSKPTTTPAPRREAAPLPTVTTAPVSFMQLRVGSCRFPFGDPRDFEALRFCGAPSEPDQSFCPAHRAICYEPRSVRVAHDKRVSRGVRA